MVVLFSDFAVFGLAVVILAAACFTVVVFLTLDCAVAAPNVALADVNFLMAEAIIRGGEKLFAPPGVDCVVHAQPPVTPLNAQLRPLNAPSYSLDSATFSRCV